MHLVASSGMDYLLGGNALGQSYVTGYGVDCSRHQRRRPLVLVATYLDSTTARELLFVPLSLSVSD